MCQAPGSSPHSRRSPEVPRKGPGRQKRGSSGSAPALGHYHHHHLGPAAPPPAPLPSQDSGLHSSAPGRMTVLPPALPPWLADPGSRTAHPSPPPPRASRWLFRPQAAGEALPRRLLLLCCVCGSFSRPPDHSPPPLVRGLWGGPPSLLPTQHRSLPQRLWHPALHGGRRTATVTPSPGCPPSAGRLLGAKPLPRPSNVAASGSFFALTTLVICRAGGLQGCQPSAFLPGPLSVQDRRSVLEPGLRGWTRAGCE